MIVHVCCPVLSLCIVFALLQRFTASGCPPAREHVARPANRRARRAARAGRVRQGSPPLRSPFSRMQHYACIKHKFTLYSTFLCRYNCIMLYCKLYACTPESAGPRYVLCCARSGPTSCATRADCSLMEYSAANWRAASLLVQHIYCSVH